MGSHLNYELSLPSGTSRAEVDALLERLRERAISLGFPLMTRITTWSEAEEEWQQVFRMMTDIVGEFEKHNALPPIAVESARGFLVHPGRGCEPASMGFVERFSNDGGQPEWFWYCRCKTQYASVFGDDYFLECHGKRPRADVPVTSSLLVVEVLSEGSRRHDRLTKRHPYQRAGVPEYWILDQDAQVVERWRPSDDRPDVLDAELRWHPVATVEPLTIDLVSLFRGVLDD